MNPVYRAGPRSAVSLLLLAGVSACSSGPSSSTAKHGGANIAWISKGRCNSFFVLSRSGAALAGQDLTAAAGTAVDVQVLEPNDCGDAGATGAVATSDSGAAADAATQGADAAPGEAQAGDVADSAVATDASGASGDGGAPEASPPADGGGESGADAMVAAEAAAPDPCALNNARAQLNIIQNAIDSHVNAIALDVISPACEETTINAAVDAGIRVVTFDSDDPKSTRDTYYGMDNVAASKAALDVLASLVGGSGKIIFMTSMFKDKTGVYQLSPSQSYVDRMTGFTQGLANYPGMTMIGPVPCVGNDPGDTFCAKQIEQQLTANPDVKGIFFARGKILRDLNLATTAPQFTAARQAMAIRAVAFDAPADALANIQAGYADLVVNQKLFGWGYDVVTLAYDMVTIHRQVSSFTDSGWDAICPNNVAQYVQFTNAQDFRQPLSKCQYLP